jgi:NADP-reducing hydrogenase subunit HndB
MEPKKVRNIKDLLALKAQFKKDMDLRAKAGDISITVHMGTCGIGAGARDVLKDLSDALERAAVENVVLKQSGCLGYCEKEPMLTYQDRTGQLFYYGPLNRDAVQRIVREHVLADRPVREIIIQK